MPFPRFTYDEALERFGSDKPDLRFGMELADLGPALVDAAGAPASGFRVFDETLAAGGRVKGIAVPGLADASRARIDELTEAARRYGARGLVTLAVAADGDPRAERQVPRGGAARRRSRDRCGAVDGDLVLIVADRATVVADVLGRLRVELGTTLGLADPTVLAYCWVDRFPMYEWDAERNGWHATHNPFSGVVPEDEPLLVTASGDPERPSPDDPAGRARAMQYDLALNGWELGGGSVRIHQRALLERSFALQGHTRGLDAREVRRHAGRVRVRRAAARRDRDRDRSLGRPAGRPGDDPGGHGVPQDVVGFGPDARRAVRARPRPVRGAGPAVRGVSRPGLSARGCPARDNGAGASIQGGPP